MNVTRHPISTSTRAPGGATNAYVVDTVLIDPAARTEALDSVLEDRSIEHVLLTHTHPDHTGALAEYATERDLTVWALQGYQERFEAVTGVEPDRLCVPGTTIRLDEGVLRILDTPGHAPDHLAIQAGEGGPILCGDCILSTGSVVVAAPEGDMRAYLTSVRRLWAIDPPQLLPGHGPPIDEPRPALERLLEHRYRRERRVLAAVEAGGETADEVLEIAYEKDLTGVRDLARATVVAHLEKLAVEGRLEWDGTVASP